MGFSETNGFIYVKLGGSFITYKDRPFSINFEALEKTIDILSSVKDKEKMILGNGGGSFAHTIVKSCREEEPDSMLVLCQNITRKLNTIIVNYLVSHGILVTGIQTSAIIVEEEGDFKVFTKPLTHALENNIIPIVYGECIFSAKNNYRILSTEKIFKILSNYFRPKHIVLLTDVDGVYTCDPKTCSEAELIRRIDKYNFGKVLEILERTESRDVTGSIYGKVLSMVELSRELGVKIYIVSGFNVEESINAILGKDIGVGTIIDMN